MLLPEHKSMHLSAELAGYVVAHTTPPDAVAQRLIDETWDLGGASIMQIPPEQAAFMTMLVQLMGARRIVEVGTFTGYSALALARGLPPDGTLLCCDVEVAWADIARRHWAAAGLADRIELRIAPAITTLRSLPAEEWIDLAFVDADKGSYVAYYEELVPRLRPGGVLLADNVFIAGTVVHPAPEGSGTAAMQAFNDHVAADPRVDVAMLPLSDGLSVIRKR